MKSLLFLACLLHLSCANVLASRKDRHRHPATEQDMLDRIFSCIQTKDAYSYAGLFPESDSLAYWIIKVADPKSDQFFTMQAQLENPETGMRKDSAMNARLMKEFDRIMQRGDKMGINWGALVPVRHELLQARKTRDTLYEKLAPVRFKGYLFMRDMLTRKTYGVALADIMYIQGSWYGGEILNIYQAATADEYLTRQAKERGRIEKGLPGNFGMDEEETAVDTTEERVTIRKQVLDRKIFTGTFDNEIAVQLYIRYLRGGCPETICSWDGLFKFGEDEYVRVEISRTSDSTWHFEEKGGDGVMDLKLDGETFTGVWVAPSDQTSYEAELSDTPVSNKKLRSLDAILDK